MTTRDDGNRSASAGRPENAGPRFSFALICVEGFLGRLSYEMIRSPLTSLYARHLGAPVAVVGLLVSAVTITGIFVKFPAGALADLFGFRTPMMAGLCVKASAPFLYLLVASWPQLLALRLYHGLSTALYAPAASAVVAKLYPAERGRRLGFYGAAENAGVVLGPVASAALLSAAGFSTSFIVSGIVGVAALLALLPLHGLPPASAERGTAAPSVWEVVRQIRSGLVEIVGDPAIRLVSLMEGSLFFAVGTLQAYLPLYAVGIGLPVWTIGWLYGAQGVMSIVLRPAMGTLADRIGRRPQIIIGVAIAAGVLAAVPHVASLGGLLALTTAFGIATAAVTPATTALIGDLAKDRGLGAAMGVFGSLWDIGHAAGPLIAGPLIATLGYAIAFAIIAAMILTVLSVFVRGSISHSRRA